MHINDFDNNMRHKRSRNPEDPPPQIDVSNGYPHMDEKYVHDIPSNTEVLRSHMFLKMKTNGILKLVKLLAVMLWIAISMTNQ